MKKWLFLRPAGRCLVMLFTCGAAWQPALSHAQRGPERTTLQPVYQQWTTYLNPRFGFQVPVPPGLRAQSDPKLGGTCRFVSDDGVMELKVWGSSLASGPGDPLEDAWREAVNLRGRRVDYHRRTRTGFVLRGLNHDGRAFFEKVVLGRRATAGANLSYPSPLAGRFAPWVQEIERGLTWLPEAGPVSRRSDPESRGFFSGIRNYFTGADEVPPPPWNTPSAGLPPRQDPRQDFRTEPGVLRDPDDTRIDLSPPQPNPDEDPAALSLDPPAATPPAPKPVPAKREDLPYGIAIPGKKGYVYSPYVDTKQQVDVTEIPTGTKVKCPYTGKVFRVP